MYVLDEDPRRLLAERELRPLHARGEEGRQHARADRIDGPAVEDDGQRVTALAPPDGADGLPGPGTPGDVIAQLVPQDGERMVVQVRHHHPPLAAGFHRAVIPIEDLQDVGS